jgi:hypothetical protein
MAGVVHIERGYDLALVGYVHGSIAADVDRNFTNVTQPRLDPFATDTSTFHLCTGIAA